MTSRPVTVALCMQIQFEISALSGHTIDPYYIWAQFMIFGLDFQQELNSKMSRDTATLNSILILKVIFSTLKHNAQLSILNASQSKSFKHLVST